MGRRVLINSRGEEEYPDCDWDVPEETNPLVTELAKSLSDEDAKELLAYHEGVVDGIGIMKEKEMLDQKKKDFEETYCRTCGSQMCEGPDSEFAEGCQHINSGNDQKVKADKGKPKLSLVPMKIVYAIEMIRSYGNNKYPEGGPDNWKQVDPPRHHEASLRHTVQSWDDPFRIDPESGYPHYFHKVCDDAFFIEQNWDKFIAAIKAWEEEHGTGKTEAWRMDRQRVEG